MPLLMVFMLSRSEKMQEIVFITLIIFIVRENSRGTVKEKKIRKVAWT